MKNQSRSARMKTYAILQAMALPQCVRQWWQERPIA